MRTDKSRKRFVFLCVAPATILFFLFMILPTLNVFRMSLYERFRCVHWRTPKYGCPVRK